MTATQEPAPDGVTEDPRDAPVLRPTERIVDFATVMAHVTARGETDALTALGIEASDWVRASRWASKLTAEAMGGGSSLTVAFGMAYASEAAAIAAARAAAAAPRDEDPASDDTTGEGPSVLAASNAAAIDPREAERREPPPPERPAFRLDAPASRWSPPPRVAPPSAPVDNLDDPTVDAIYNPFGGSTTASDALLPFRATEDDEPTARRSAREGDDWMPLPLDRYASLCASLEAFSEAEVLAQFNLPSSARLAEIHEAFRVLFERDPEIHERFVVWQAKFAARIRELG